MAASSKTLGKRKRLSSSSTTAALTIPKELISRSSLSSAAAFTIPEDLITEIFLRLPVKSLARLRCLSKSCQSLIDSRDFVGAYSSGYVPEDNTPCAVIAQSKYPLHALKLDFTIDESDPDFNTAKATSELIPPLKIKPYEELCSFYLVGCCRGILCYSLVYRDHKLGPFFILWNPSTGYYRKIKIGIVPKNPYINVINIYNCYFGYDHVNHDYKLLRSINGGGKLHFKVYSFKMLSPSSSSSWRKIKCDFPFSSWRRVGSGAFVDGTNAIHFIALQNDGNNHWNVGIVAFDLATENFSFVPPPTPVPGLGFMRSVGCLDGCLYFFEDNNYNDCVNVWMMKDYGVQNSWLKLITRERHENNKCTIMKLVAFSQSGKKILVLMLDRLQKRQKLQWCDLHNQELQNGGPLEFSGLPGCWDVHICSTCVARP